MDGKPHPAWLAATLALLLAAPPGARAEEKAPGEDVVLRAMKDEMARSQERLRLGDMEKPYYLAYTAESGTVFAAGAVLGATSGGGEGPVRSLEAEARVGDYALDSSTGYSSGGGADPGLEDDYDAVRFQLWQATDEQYKAALEGLTRKQAALKARQVKDRPDDFSREDPVAWSDPAVSLAVDRARWTEAVRKVSAVFREYPEIHTGSADFRASALNRTYLNSEGFLQRTALTAARFSLRARTQAEDGMPLNDAVEFLGRSEKDLPTTEELCARARKTAETLLALRKAPKAEDYTGPVLFEGEAAAGVFLRVLAENLYAQRESDEGGRRGSGNRFEDKIGKRILAKFVDAFDDPSRREFGGKTLTGAYDVDDEGVRPAALRLVEKGKLLTLYATRTPTKPIRKSNGHCRNGRPGPGCLFVESAQGLSAEALKAKLIELVRDEGLPYGILARRTDEIWRVWAEDGREEIVRGASWGAFQPRLLRDIAATGTDAAAYNFSRASVICPSILVEEMDLQKPGENFPKPPYLETPIKK